MRQGPTRVVDKAAIAADFPRPFGNVALLKRLAKDERAEVYLALRPEGVDRLCVVSLFDPARAASGGMVDKLRAEASWLVSRVHGNLVQIYDVGQSGDRLFFLSEWVEGADLGTLIARAGGRPRPHAIGNAVLIALETAAALHFIRSQEERATGVATAFVGFSASSVLVSREGQVKLLHQGSCLNEDPSTYAERDWARVSLMAPEHVDGRGSERGDVFAVGALLWQILVGRGLAQGEVALHQQRLRSRAFLPTRLSSAVAAGIAVPPGLDALVNAALSPRAEDRPANLEQMRAELASALRALPAGDAPAIGALVTDLVGPDLKVQSEELSRLGARATGMFGAGLGKSPTVTLTNFDDAPAAASDRNLRTIPEADLTLGAPIPGTRYRAIQKLGEGGMGAVYLAEHVDIEKRVALKLLHGELVRNPYVLRQFRQEARAASRIGNPYICDVTDWGEVADGRVFFVMEFLDGPPLSKVLKQTRRLPPERAIPVIRQVAKALGSAHDKGIVHLDVKPDNVLLVERHGRQETVKVVDFGIAGLLGQPGAPSRVMGTPEYMAPERAMGKAYDHRSDIYSLGVMAFEMLVGEVPFQGATPVKTLAMHVTDKADRLNERSTTAIPSEIEALVLHMLEKDPARRPQTMEEVEELLCQAQADAGIRTLFDDLPLPPMAAERAARISRYMAPESQKTRATVIVASSIAIASLGVAVYFAARDPNAGGGIDDLRPTHVVEAPASVPTAPLRPSAVTPLPPTPAAPPPVPPAEPPVVVGAAPAPTEPKAKPPEPKEKERRIAAPARPRDPAGAAESVERGTKALRAGRISFAGQQFQAAVESDPSNAGAWTGLSEVAFEEARYKASMEHARRAVQLDRRKPRGFLLLGQAYFRLGDYKHAGKAFERGLALAPNDPDLKAEMEKVRRLPK